MGASPTLSNIIFKSNIAHGSGGAVDCGTGSPRIIRCTFIDNQAQGMGGGVYASGTGDIMDCVFMGCTVNSVKGQGGGLGIYGSPKVTNCIFRDCSAGLGGGVSIAKSSSPDIVNCTLINNDAPQGAGIGLYYANLLTLVNTVIAFNTQGAAVDGNGSVNAAYCNVFGNEGGDYTALLQGQLGNNGNISLDPLFADGPDGDCHLCYDSPCRDAGDNAAPGLSAEDFEGDPRTAFKLVDMGADEFFTHLYCTGDVAPGSWIDVKFVGVPNTVPVGLCISAGLLDPPLKSMWGDWFLAFPFIGPIDFGALPMPSGVLAVQGMIPLSPPGPYSLFLQALIGSELTNPFALTVK